MVLTIVIMNMGLPIHPFIMISIVDDKGNFDEYGITNPPIGVAVQMVVRLNDGDHVPQEVHLVVVENLIIREQ